MATKSLRHVLKDSVPWVYWSIRSAELRLQIARWRWMNISRSLKALFSSTTDPESLAMADELTREGIILRDFKDAFECEDAVFEEAKKEAEILFAEAKAKAGKGEPDFSKEEQNVYKANLLDGRISADSPFARLALDNRILSVVNRYMGMRSKLRCIHVWWDRPTNEPPGGTQLWHRDGDDVINAKVFVYFNDVDLETGPFTYAPKTHFRGVKRLLSPETAGGGRVLDDAMIKEMPSSDWKVCTGSPGTVAMCDTVGWHRGLKPEKKDRLLLMLHYVSGTSSSERDFELVDLENKKLTSIQLDALS